MECFEESVGRCQRQFLTTGMYVRRMTALEPKKMQPASEFCSRGALAKVARDFCMPGMH